MQKIIMKIDKKSLLSLFDDINKTEDDVVKLEIALPEQVKKLTKTQKESLEKLSIFELVD